MKRTLRYGAGYKGKLGNKCWIARITGTDAEYGLSREFLEPTSVERQHFNRIRTIIEFTYDLETDGLYELCEEGERWFEMCYLSATTGEQKTRTVSDVRVTAWVEALNAGETDRDARLSSKGA
jgi:hypothetical protein